MFLCLLVQFIKIERIRWMYKSRQAASIFNGDDSYSQSLSFFLNKQFCCPYKRKR